LPGCAAARDFVLAGLLGLAVRRDPDAVWLPVFALIAADRSGDRFRRRVAGLVESLMDGCGTRRRFGIAAFLDPGG
jgi:hypothetical protein